MEFYTISQNDEIYHFGVKGMKWGVRKDRRSLGNKYHTRVYNRTMKDVDSLKKHGYKEEAKAVQAVADKHKAKAKASQTKYDEKNKRKADLKNRRNLSDADLQKKVNRLKLEKQFKELTNEDIAPGRTATKKFMSSVGGRVLMSASIGALAYAGKYALTKNVDLKDLAGYMFPNPHKKK